MISSYIKNIKNDLLSIYHNDSLPSKIRKANKYNVDIK